MIEDNIVDCIITLPDKLFSTTGIPVALWFLRKQKQKKDEILFIDMRDYGTLIDKTTRVIDKKEIEEISNIYHNWLNDDNYDNIKGLCYSAKLDEIKHNNYSLVSGRYVGIKDDDEMTEEELNQNINQVSIELKELLNKNKELSEKLEKILDII